MAKTSTQTKGKTVKAKHITKVKPAQATMTASTATSSRPPKGMGCRPTDEV